MSTHVPGTEKYATYSAQDISQFSAYDRNQMYRCQSLGEVPFPVSGDATADDAAWGI